MRLGCRAVGCDIDPLARMIAAAKLTPIDPIAALLEGNKIIDGASDYYRRARWRLQRESKLRFDAKTRKFIRYWFLPQHQLELLALVQRIESLPRGGTRDFLRVVFSSTIIAKSGGVSLARDLAHTRPHRDTQKTPPSAFIEFGRRLERNIATLDKHAPSDAASAADTGLPPASVDLIVTSPPYANNAIDSCVRISLR